MSEIERGQGSFTAEQLMLLLELFNVSVARFSDRAIAHGPGLQMSLAQYGASHLVEPADTLPSERIADLGALVREVLLDGDPRLVTALAPVLLRHAEKVNLARVELELQRVGYDRRLPWLVANVLQATTETRGELLMSKKTLPGRANLSRYLDLHPPAEPALFPDVLDPSVRSAKSVKQISESASDISRRWHIVTVLQPSDFATALRAADDRD